MRGHMCEGVPQGYRIGMEWENVLERVSWNRIGSRVGTVYKVDSGNIRLSLRQEIQVMWMDWNGSRRGIGD